MKILKVRQSKPQRRSSALFKTGQIPASELRTDSVDFARFESLLFGGPAAPHCSLSYSTSSRADHSVWTEAVWLLPPDQGRTPSDPKAVHWGRCRSKCSHSGALKGTFSSQNPDINTERAPVRHIGCRQVWMVVTATVFYQCFSKGDLQVVTNRNQHS